MAIYTLSGQEVKPGAHIVVFENFPGMVMSQWCVAVYHHIAAYDSPYDPIVWMGKCPFMKSPQQVEFHNRNRELAELFADAIRASLNE